MIIGLAILIFTVTKTLTTLPEDGSVAAIFAPWSDARANWGTVVAADGLVARQIWGGMILVAVPARPGLADRLNGPNLWAIINPGAVGGCGSP